MDIVSTLLIAVALAMDAFSVSLTKGFAMPKISKMQILWFAIFFGGFQSLMPAIGYLAGMHFNFRTMGGIHTPCTYRNKHDKGKLQ